MARKSGRVPSVMQLGCAHMEGRYFVESRMAGGEKLISGA